MNKNLVNLKFKKMISFGNKKKKKMMMIVILKKNLTDIPEISPKVLQKNRIKIHPKKEILKFNLMTVFLMIEKNENFLINLILKKIVIKIPKKIP
jgi:hypothetical protein